MVPESYRWEYTKVNQAEVRRLAVETGYPEIFAGLLAARGISSRAEAERFLNASADDMYSPFLMNGMAVAVDRISKAVDHGEKITIYGDYDVDGITATSILYLFLKEIHADVHYYLPDRMTEGYGLNAHAVRMLGETGTRLIITVDTGIAAVEECRLANALGMDVIVTDHHECQAEIPEALAVIDAKQPNEQYPFQYLAGCGVAYKVVQGLAVQRNYHGNIRKYLELAAVGTVADIVPLYDENRMIVSEGFQRMRHPEIMGLRKLLESSGYDFRRRITSGFIGFVVAPRLNAGGRMGDAERGVRLFTSEDETEASDIAEALKVENDHRKETEQYILQAVTDKIQASGEIQKSRVMVIAGKGWHHGVIGIVSSRIKDMYYRPNILLSVENGIATGSARSIDGFNLFEALCSCSDLMLRFGGHAAAAGMTLKEENIPELTRRLNAYAREHMDSRMMIPVQRPEAVLQPSEVTTALIEMIESMEPFGPGMPEPLIEVSGNLSEVRTVGADAGTLRMRIGDGKASITAIGFRRAVLKNYYTPGMEVSIAGNLGINEYMGRLYPQIMVRDVRRKLHRQQEMLNDIFSLRHITNDYRVYCEKQEKLNRETCSAVYRFLTAQARRQGTADSGSFLMEDMPVLEGRTALDRVFGLMQALYVFEELGLLQIETAGPYLSYQLVKDKKARLVDSEWFCRYFEG